MKSFAWLLARADDPYDKSGPPLLLVHLCAILVSQGPDRSLGARSPQAARSRERNLEGRHADEEIDVENSLRLGYSVDWAERTSRTYLGYLKLLLFD
ncbi:hypothetical protein V5O48_014554 [Marasmius crinis-equi]|uniref:Uncharacterized protein n=1 Tax=Marasmius crinis-equi TaxID=585013 RepID=A0ABR3EX05_9AGAR